MSRPESPAGLRTPLTDAEFEELDELCNEYSPFDLDGLIGLFHALGAGPGDVPTATWLTAAFPEMDQSSQDGNECVGYALRLHNEVVTALAEGQHLIPTADELEQCEAFAAGYTAGVYLDEKWTDNDDALVLSQAIAYLGDCNDVLEAETIAQLEHEFGPEPKLAIAEELMGIVAATYETFHGPWKQEKAAKGRPVKH